MGRDTHTRRHAGHGCSGTVTKQKYGGKCLIPEDFWAPFFTAPQAKPCEIKACSGFYPSCPQCFPQRLWIPLRVGRNSLRFGP